MQAKSLPRNMGTIWYHGKEKPTEDDYKTAKAIIRCITRWLDVGNGKGKCERPESPPSLEEVVCAANTAIKAHKAVTKAYEKVARERTSINVGLYGIKDISQFEVKGELETNEKDLLKDISWDIGDDPSKAESRTKHREGRAPAKVDLSQRLFNGPILLELYSRNCESTYRVPVFGGTIGDVLSVVHNFYQIYTHTDTIDDGIWFEGLGRSSPEVWFLYLGS